MINKMFKEIEILSIMFILSKKDVLPNATGLSIGQPSVPLL